MQDHSEISDEEFQIAFENCSLNPSLFSHEAHLRLAWIHIKKYGIEHAIINIKDQLKRYVKAAGASDKYNETVTVAGIKAVNHFILRSETNSFTDFINQNNQLLLNFKALLLSHYKTNIFESHTAKLEYLKPELIPFD